ncbi:hypothetical protein [Cellulomonas sp. ATA003]|uniref:hypothetical protein n=1 Tax=Cellulomonas sp. ATA003 TaxID=3073064 RepID=UPI0028738B57|nr:hypothetical protein [Cellulomonas sp. ATA003]WNB86270.1 hypothetical protein REH70_03135 [Cellulomonas sp. ATA003]
MGGLVALVVAAVGQALGQGVAAWREVARPSGPGARIARASTPVHSDYVARHERWGAWVLAGAALAAAVVIAAAPGSGFDVGPLPWALVVATAVVPGPVMAVYEVAAARLLDRPQVATTTLELAWDDALRASTLRDMLGAALAIGLALPVALLSVVSDGLVGGWPGNPAVGLVGGIVAVILGGGMLMVLVSAILEPHRHFRRRLWPLTVEPVEPVEPGEPVGPVGPGHRVDADALDARTRA